MSTAAYLSQALSSDVRRLRPELAVALFGFGKVLAGLFSGTGPVLEAIVIRSPTSTPTMCTQMTILKAATFVPSGVLMVISGLLGAVDFRAPYLFSASVGACISVYVALVRRGINEQQRNAPDCADYREPSLAQDGPRPTSGRQPWSDPLIWLGAVTQFTFAFCGSSQSIMLPLILLNPRFGLGEGISMPLGVTYFFGYSVMMAVMPVAARLERLLPLLGYWVLPVPFALNYLLIAAAREPWHVMAIIIVGGVFPAMIFQPTTALRARYVRHFCDKEDVPCANNIATVCSKLGSTTGYYCGWLSIGEDDNLLRGTLYLTSAYLLTWAASLAHTFAVTHELRQAAAADVAIPTRPID